MEARLSSRNPSPGQLVRLLPPRGERLTLQLSLGAGTQLAGSDVVRPS